MGWEDRNGRSYYYRKERSGNKVRSVYVGGGEVAGLCAALDGMVRSEAKDEREAKRRARARDTELDRAGDELGEMIKTLTTAALLAEGFHTHKRQWRRTRDE